MQRLILGAIKADAKTETKFTEWLSSTSKPLIFDIPGPEWL